VTPDGREDARGDGRPPSARSPAVDHDGPGVLGVVVLDLLEELEHADGRERHAEVRPAGEVELGDEPLRLLPRHVAHLRRRRRRRRRRSQVTDQWISRTFP